MTRRALFLGEGELAGPARYLAAILKDAGFSFDRQPDAVPVPRPWLGRRYHVIILSDYRHSALGQRVERWIGEKISRGTGLLMIGGWASFSGTVGRYNGTLIESLLPVTCLPMDDRAHRPSGALILPVVASSVAKRLLTGLDWHHPPVVCGYHHVALKKNVQTFLQFRDLKVEGPLNRRRSMLASEAKPALVVSDSDGRRSAAFMTDCAPHWAGGLVDWGKKRRRVVVAPGNVVEVGDSYLQFFGRLLRWLAKI